MMPADALNGSLLTLPLLVDWKKSMACQKISRLHITCLALATLNAIVGCGGGSYVAEVAPVAATPGPASAPTASAPVQPERTPVPLTELSASTLELLQGSWPPGTGSIAVRTQEEWQTLWAARQRWIAMTSYPYETARNLPQPPAIDFGNYALVGLFIGSSSSFVGTTPKRVYVAVENPTSIVVEYYFDTITRVAFYDIPNTRFFLIPRTPQVIDIRGMRWCVFGYLCTQMPGDPP